jgi:hypothetical protein
MIVFMANLLAQRVENRTFRPNWFGPSVVMIGRAGRRRNRRDADGRGRNVPCQDASSRRTIAPTRAAASIAGRCSLSH